jgi:Coenzyme PQQ synthesis protein D (PqqD)
MKISSDSIVVATDSQVSTALGAETVILHFDKGSYFGLNEVGTAIWGRLHEPHMVSELCDAILAEYEVEPQRCQQDVLRLLEKLQDEGLIEVRSEPAA